MERETGIEPATSSLGSWRSTAELLPLSYREIITQRTEAQHCEARGGTRVIPSSQELPVVNQKVIRYELYCPATTQYVLLMMDICTEGQTNADSHSHRR